jgi:hypothetical protein
MASAEPEAEEAAESEEFAAKLDSSEESLLEELTLGCSSLAELLSEDLSVRRIATAAISAWRLSGEVDFDLFPLDFCERVEAEPSLSDLDAVLGAGLDFELASAVVRLPVWAGAGFRDSAGAGAGGGATGAEDSAEGEPSDDDPVRFFKRPRGRSVFWRV